jgi:hypothetical protein
VKRPRKQYQSEHQGHDAREPQHPPRGQTAETQYIAAVLPQFPGIQGGHRGVEAAVLREGRLEGKGREVIPQTQLAAELEGGVVRFKEELRPQVEGISVPVRPYDASPGQLLGLEGYDVRAPLAQGVDGGKTGSARPDYDYLHLFPPA